MSCACSITLGTQLWTGVLLFTIFLADTLPNNPLEYVRIAMFSLCIAWRQEARDRASYFVYRVDNKKDGERQEKSKLSFVARCVFLPLSVPAP